jgi:hypothetical protein
MLGKKFLVATAMFATATLAACGTPRPNPDQPTDKNSPMYEQGYRDGCAAVNARFRAQAEHEGPAQDEKLYATDPNYHDGWDGGFRKCEDKVNQGGLPIPGNSVIL